LAVFSFLASISISAQHLNFCDNPSFTRCHRFQFHHRYHFLHTVLYIYIYIMTIGYLKTKAMVMEGWLTNVTFFPSTSVFRSLHLCSCFSLLVFSLFIFYFSCSLCLFLFLFLLVSLCIICVSSFFVCDFLYYLFVVLPFCGFCLFILVSLGLYLLVGSTTYGEGKLKFPFAGGRSQVSLSSLCLCFFLG
jgi:hypothetical protein